MVRVRSQPSYRGLKMSSDLQIGDLIYELRSMSVGFRHNDFLQFSYVTDQAATRLKVTKEAIAYLQHTNKSCTLTGKCSCGLSDILWRLA